MTVTLPITQGGVLVVGGDSLVGRAVITALERRGHRVFQTTRRRGTVSHSRIFLDFEKGELFDVPSGVTVALVVAAATNYERCETDPLSRVINEELIPKFVVQLLNSGLFVTLISTNSVFGGERPWSAEDDPHDARIAYAIQKSNCEKAARIGAASAGVSDRLNITRLTKILDGTVSPLPAWFSAWRKGLPVEPFSDLIFAPITTRFVGDALATIAEKCPVGNLHISGESNVSYVDLATGLARRLGISSALVRPTSATERGVKIAFKPTYSGIGMERTSRILNLNPQSFPSLVEELAEEFQRTEMIDEQPG
jgi:dTDP-4-dehydrorhamnose reductase